MAQNSFFELAIYFCTFSICLDGKLAKLFTKTPSGNLAVVDIAKDTTPRVPKTWPGLPILLDSPGWDPIFSKQTLTVKVPFAASVDLSTLNYDGVTAGLRVNQSLHAPLLCVVDVLDIASCDLSLPGKLGY